MVKINNFRKADNKLSYAYLLTPSGIDEKACLTVAFLHRKMHEYNALQEEIEVLRREVLSAGAEYRDIGDGAAFRPVAIGTRSDRTRISPRLGRPIWLACRCMLSRVKRRALSRTRGQGFLCILPTFMVERLSAGRRVRVTGALF